MKTKYKTVYFIKAKKNWLCKDILDYCLIGMVIYQVHRNIKSSHYFLPADTEDVYLNSVCLRDIADFIDQLNKETK